jgi:iron only hydrogenase large subunit-like protein
MQPVQDCLACSGCVTSAETVLLEHQSGEEFLAKLADPGTTVVVSLSPQSRAALAAFHGLPPGEAQRRLAGFLKGLGVRAVLDASVGRDFALLEAAAEFVERYQSAHPQQQPGEALGPPKYWL